MTWLDWPKYSHQGSRPVKRVTDLKLALELNQDAFCLCRWELEALSGTLRFTGRLSRTQSAASASSALPHQAGLSPRSRAASRATQSSWHISTESALLAMFLPQHQFLKDDWPTAADWMLPMPDSTTCPALVKHSAKRKRKRVPCSSLPSMAYEGEKRAFHTAMDCCQNCLNDMQQPGR